MAVSQELAGELHRYCKRLAIALEDTKQQLGVVRAQIRAENCEAQLLAALTPEEQAALQPVLEQWNLAELLEKRDLLERRRGALVKAIGLVGARLNG